MLLIKPPFVYKYSCLCFNKSTFNWTFCQLLRISIWKVLLSRIIWIHYWRSFVKHMNIITIKNWYYQYKWEIIYTNWLRPQNDAPSLSDKIIYLNQEHMLAIQCFRGRGSYKDIRTHWHTLDILEHCGLPVTKVIKTR